MLTTANPVSASTHLGWFELCIAGGALRFRDGDHHACKLGKLPNRAGGDHKPLPAHRPTRQPFQAHFRHTESHRYARPTHHADDVALATPNMAWESSFGEMRIISLSQSKR